MLPLNFREGELVHGMNVAHTHSNRHKYVLTVAIKGILDLKKFRSSLGSVVFKTNFSYLVVDIFTFFEVFKFPIKIC